MGGGGYTSETTGQRGHRAHEQGRSGHLGQTLRTSFCARSITTSTSSIIITRQPYLLYTVRRSRIAGTWQPRRRPRHKTKDIDRWNQRLPHASPLPTRLETATFSPRSPGQGLDRAADRPNIRHLPILATLYASRPLCNWSIHPLLRSREGAEVDRDPGQYAKCVVVVVGGMGGSADEKSGKAKLPQITNRPSRKQQGHEGRPSPETWIAWLEKPNVPYKKRHHSSLKKGGPTHR